MKRQVRAKAKAKSVAKAKAAANKATAEASSKPASKAKGSDGSATKPNTASGTKRPRLPADGAQVAYKGGSVRLKLGQGKFVVRIPRALVADGRDKEVVVDRRIPPEGGKEAILDSFNRCLDKIEEVIGERG